MKKSKIIIPALAMLVMSTAATVTGTVAWFSMNKTVSAEGMKVRAMGQGSIIIAPKGTLPTASTKTTAVDFADTEAETLYPSTHAFASNPKSPATSETSATGLVRVSNGADVNPETGSHMTEDGTLYTVVVGGNETHYFKDYTVYISGDGQAFTEQDIDISLEASSTNDNDINKAISVDFYYQEITSANGVPATTSSTYIETLNVAGVKNNADDCSTTAQTAITLENVAIPRAGGDPNADPVVPNKTLGILMRVYYDGALIEQGSATDKTGTVYEAATGTKPANGAPYYYLTDDGTGGIVEVASGASVSGLYIVDTTNSTTRYASSNEIAEIEDVALKVTFTARVHD